MSTSYCRIIAIGKSSKPRVFTWPDGSKSYSFRLGVDRYIAQGRKKTDWWEVVVPGLDRFARVLNEIPEGGLVLVEGRLHQNERTREGVKRTYIDIYCDYYEVIHAPEGMAGSPEQWVRPERLGAPSLQRYDQMDAERRSETTGKEE